MLPGPDEAQNRLRKFQVAPRLTTHVRHKSKYVDPELVGGLGFVFTDSGVRLGRAARTLQEFVNGLRTKPLSSLRVTSCAETSRDG